jgi:hypothetical protein
MWCFQPIPEPEIDQHPDVCLAKPKVSLHVFQFSFVLALRALSFPYSALKHISVFGLDRMIKARLYR